MKKRRGAPIKYALKHSKIDHVVTVFGRASFCETTKKNRNKIIQGVIVPGNEVMIEEMTEVMIEEMTEVMIAEMTEVMIEEMTGVMIEEMTEVMIAIDMTHHGITGEAEGEVIHRINCMLKI